MDIHDKARVFTAAWTGFNLDNTELKKMLRLVESLFPKNSVKVTGKHVYGWADVPQRPAPPFPETPGPCFGVSICFYKMQSISKDIQFLLLLFSCHSQLKSINGPE